MEGIFIKLLNLSIQASILITVVLLLRFILNKSPKSIKCLLWALVAIRLVCPFSIESKFSLAPDAGISIQIKLFLTESVLHMKKMVISSFIVW